jgi:type II secretory ATPase GspE/PulE/Tfp pilus assembly ATPase PilB-like protein
MQSALAADPKIGPLLVKEGLLTPENLAKTLAIQKKQYPRAPLGEVCIALGHLTSEDLNRVLVKHNRRIPLGELLVHLGVLTTEQLNEFLHFQQKQRPRKKLGRMIVDKGLIDEATLIRVLYDQAQAGHFNKNCTLGKFEPLVIAGYLTDSELDAALKRAELQKLPLETILIDRYRVSKQELGAALSAFYGCPFVEYDPTRIAPREYVQQINPAYLKANHWIPLEVSDHSVTVLIDDPQSIGKMQDIRRLFPGKVIERLVGLKDDILKYIARALEHSAPSANRESLDSLVGQLNDQDLPELSQASEEQLLDENDSAVVRLVNRIITEACNQGVSDIHIEPAGSDEETAIRFRLDGRCFDYLRVPAAYRRALVSRIKIMARLDIAERRKPQDGKITFKRADRSFELRVATVPTAGLNNEDVVLRLLTMEKPKALHQLNMTARNLSEFQNLLRKSCGLILCVGPTGSGKTTTLHSALSSINTRERKIWTAEDPVEITQPGLRQVQVQPKIGFGFAAAMRAFLRADPDVIMVGEIRDGETAEMVVEASLTGHLVMSTLHTNSAAETLTRLLDMGIDAFNFADSLLGVLAQRLARTLCSDCKEPYHPPEEEFAALAHGFGEYDFGQLGYNYGSAFRLYRGRGCASCRNTGYKGRIALHELMIVTDDLRQLIHSKATAAALLEQALADGMTTLMRDGILKTLEGWTDYNQVKAVAMR